VSLRGPQRLIFMGALVTVFGLAVAATAPIIGVGQAERIQVQQGAGGLLVLAGWILLALGIHKLGREG
jgi:hypothetical protein